MWGGLVEGFVMGEGKEGLEEGKRCRGGRTGVGEVGFVAAGGVGDVFGGVLHFEPVFLFFFSGFYRFHSEVGSSDFVLNDKISTILTGVPRYLFTKFLNTRSPDYSVDLLRY